VLRGLDPNKIIFALGSYGYDWTEGKKQAEAVTFHEAMQSAHDSGVKVVFDRTALNPGFSYADDQNVAHHVWFLDAATLFNQIKVSDAWKPRGYALWRLGAEDPGIWTLLDKPYGAVSTAGLPTMPASHDIDFNGFGEVMNVSAQPTPGQRTVVQDKPTGLISDETYEVYPTAWVVQRLGQHPGKVALTFDDGPDPRWTPHILDILKRYNAPATFFVIGRNMEDFPEIVEREVAEGHIVGGHTFTHPNIADETPSAVPLEFNLTQRLFQTITGRTQRFFRPPYLGDASPSTATELQPLLIAQKLGYVTVGLRIDPDDWNRPDADLIVARTLKRLEDTNPETGGQVVLLHDSGGNRERTIQALPKLIEALRAKGYQLVTVADLIGMPPTQAMPKSSAPPMQLALDRAVFSSVRGFNKFVAFLFLSAIGIGLLRLLFLASLALYHRARIERRAPDELSPENGPFVSVLIPCFNEEAVIVSSVRQILESNWTQMEILVIDDGSKDNTAAEVEKHFAGHPLVRLLRLKNGGKAMALNQGLTLAKGDIIVALDADTLFGRSTIGRLARWFTDPKVGAVAGNALVGNQVNTVTRWQALEYVSAQNLERRALAALGTVTVVPGAVGAWRKKTLEELGGFPHDTLAEDQDLTLAAQARGWRVEFDPEAVAFTEAPETVAGLLKQRFRWSFGTLQCVWKHRENLFNRKNPALGFIALPQIWLFQIFLTTAAPLVDLAVIFSLIGAVFDRLAHPVEWNSEGLTRAMLYWAAFVLVDLAAAVIGMAMERRAPWGSLAWLPAQRFGYRQLMYYVVVKAVFSAIHGRKVEWGSLERTASAVVDTRGDETPDADKKAVPASAR
jgi:cellulose synthase/poly-beta-1,6-N-acetylglucosamine synthase-like glycosyltransferase/peptidoglycan/xylan/chitin deacetylase (PgdA/CDA1 family)